MRPPRGIGFFCTSTFGMADVSRNTPLVGSNAADEGWVLLETSSGAPTGRQFFSLGWSEALRAQAQVLVKKGSRPEGPI